jgi:hypothetical protein
MDKEESNSMKEMLESGFRILAEELGVKDKVWIEKAGPIPEYYVLCVSRAIGREKFGVTWAIRPENVLSPHKLWWLDAMMALQHAVAMLDARK